jgi:hypothetical protein
MLWCPEHHLDASETIQVMLGHQDHPLEGKK